MFLTSRLLLYFRKVFHGFQRKGAFLVQILCNFSAKQYFSNFLRMLCMYQVEQHLRTTLRITRNKFQA